MKKELVEKLLPGLSKTREDYEAMYPKRDLKEGAIVSRYAPSPTGFVHMGALFASFIEGKMARQTGGVFYLRIEDTDQERKVENGISSIIKDLNDYGICFDEGPTSETEESGAYGPYIQSKRKEIYQAYAKDLLLKGLAYPDFSTKEELDAIREEQRASKKRIGHYGHWATSRFLTEAEIEANLEVKKPFIIRLRSNGDFNNRIVLHDAIRGDIELPENDIDTVLIKNDGLPTYHFAHAIDDHLMHTTHVIRGDEWISSVPVHLELFKVLGFEAPTYCHIAPLTKKEGNTIRKLSKRKDPELAVSFYNEQGIPKESVMTYLATVANSNFEEWYNEHPEATIEEFSMTFEKMNSTGGSLFDLEKLYNLSKNYISKLTALEVYENTLRWAKEYQPDFAKVLEENKEYSINILNIERGGEKPRKDFASYRDVFKGTWYMYKEYFYKSHAYEWGKITDLKEIKNILNTYIEYYNEKDDEEVWFGKVKEMCDTLGYASNMKDYKKNPENYKGNVADVSTVIRVAVTTLSRTPNLYDILQNLGKEEIAKRFALLGE